MNGVSSKVATPILRSAEDKIMRPQASRHEHSPTLFDSGQAAGRVWATDVATSAELGRLEEFEPDVNNVVPGDLLSEVAKLIDADVRSGMIVSRFAWRHAINREAYCRDDLENDSYVAGFLGGAMAVWREVKAAHKLSIAPGPHWASRLIATAWPAASAHASA